MAKALLLGDSIRMSYQPWVQQELDGEVEVWGPAENCQYALYTLTRLDHWLNEVGEIDVVHWNNGIHDAGHNPNRRPLQFRLEDYVGNVELILHRLRQTRAAVIWATTTPVHPDRPFTGDAWSWRRDELAEYRAAVADLMIREGIPVNDLNALVETELDAYLADDKLHLTEGGQQACAKAVAAAIRQHL